MLLKIDLDPKSLKRLTEIAVHERRPVVLQAEVLLLQALGRWPVGDDLIVIDSRHAPAETSQ